MELVITLKKNWTKPIFFDTDCLSSFLWINASEILIKLFGGRIVIANKVYEELNNKRTKHLKIKIDAMLSRKVAYLKNIDINSSEYLIYLNLINIQNMKVIGKGEAASIVLAKKYGGILASNNLSDIKLYTDKFEIKNITTADILYKLFIKSILNKDEIENMWQAMLAKKRKLGYESFSKYLNKRH